jgi:CRP-like cAMP-binding protein
VARNSNSHTFLKGLSSEQLAAVSQLAERRRFQAGETILRQREAADHFYLIDAGHVRLDYEMTPRRQVQIQELGLGEALGWSWLSPPYKWQFTAAAIDRVTASVFRIDDLRALFAREPQLGYAMMERAAQALLGRLQATRH